MNPIVWPMFIEIGLISYRSLTGLHFVVPGGTSLPPGIQGPVRSANPIKSGGVWQNTGVKRPPLPSELVAVFTAFGLFSLVATKDQRVGSLLGWGIVIATAITIFSPTGPSPVGAVSTSNPPNPPTAPNPPAKVSNPAFPPFISGSGQ